jgi:3',5'-cyclic AMP phosphodiesterase CpdA
MKIVHISDIHTAEPHFRPDLMERVLEEINNMNIDILVVTGDLTEGGYYPEFDRAESYIDRIRCKKKIIVPGNHDSRNVGYLHFEEIFGSRSGVLKDEDVTIVGVDSTEPDIDEGHIGRSNYEWIEHTFAVNGFKIFALHHHILPVPKTGRERNVLVDAGDVLDLLIKCSVNLVLCGHKHVPWIWNLEGMIILNAGTACTDRVKWNTPQSYNLIELEEEEIRIYRMYSKGGQELVFGKKQILAME